MTVKLITHTDYDGVGCAILSKLAFDDVDIDYIDYSDIVPYLNKFIDDEICYYDEVYITDLSFKDNSAINNILNRLDDWSDKVRVFDHHKTSQHADEKYDWFTMKNKLTIGDMKACGTKLFYDYLIESSKLVISKVTDNFVESVRRYDTWEWKTKYNDNAPKEWNELLTMLGIDDFVESIYNKLKNDKFFMNEKEALLLEVEQKRKQDYINKKEEEMEFKRLKIKDLDIDYTAGVVFAEQYLSDLGNKLNEKYQQLDLIIMINGNRSVSYRTIHDDVDVRKIAEHFGGGGHSSAAGNTITKFDYDDYVGKLFNYQIDSLSKTKITLIKDPITKIKKG